MGANQITPTSGVFRELAACLEGLELHGVDIIDVAPHEETLLAESGMTVDLTVAIPLMPERKSCSLSISTPDSVEYTDEGTIRFELTVEIPVESADSNGDGGLSMADLTPSGAARTATGATSEEHSESPETDLPTSNAAGDTDTTTDEPAYRDPERLAAVYDQYETFDEMTEALGVDVTAQTVRRHMIEHGIHDPAPREMGPSTADNTATDSDESPTSTAETISDVDLPADISVADLSDAVQSARTIRETSHQLELDVETTRELLMEFDLLDLVMGRIDTSDDRDISPEELENRIRMVSES